MSWENEEYTIEPRPRMTAEEEQNLKDRLIEYGKRLQIVRNKANQNLIRWKKNTTKYSGRKGLPGGPNVSNRPKKMRKLGNTTRKNGNAMNVNGNNN